MPSTALSVTRHPVTTCRGSHVPSTGGGLDEQGPSTPDLAGARARFAALVREHLDGLYRSALRLTRNRTAAEDLVQDVMLKAWSSFHVFREGPCIRAWLHRILKNAFFDAHRESKKFWKINK